MDNSRDSGERQLLAREVSSEFRSQLPVLFKRRLAFGFIFGGFGKGYAGYGHDVDMLVVVDRVEDNQAARFRDWYFQLHAQHGLPPDREHPGELVSANDLQRRIEVLETTRLRPVIPSLHEYEAILWADALGERKIGLVIGPVMSEEQVSSLIGRAEALHRRWRKEIRAWRSDSQQVQDSLDLRRLFKGHIRYLKLGRGETHAEP